MKNVFHIWNYSTFCIYITIAITILLFVQTFAYLIHMSKLVLNNNYGTD